MAFRILNTRTELSHTHLVFYGEMVIHLIYYYPLFVCEEIVSFAAHDILYHHVGILVSCPYNIYTQVCIRVFDRDRGPLATL